jgi:uncharacterized membrane protein YcaP (DUF421 family)
MDNFYPVLTTTAFFVAICIIDLIRNNARYIPLHGILGGIAVVLISYISNTLGPLAAWILLGTPVVLVILGILIEGNINQNRIRYQYLPYNLPPSKMTTPCTSNGCLNPASIQSA